MKMLETLGQPVGALDPRISARIEATRFSLMPMSMRFPPRPSENSLNFLRDCRRLSPQRFSPNV